MPIDPRMATCILNSSKNIDSFNITIDKEEWKVTEEVLSIAALMSV